ncbi:thiol reductase thioredoxin [Aquibacillus halophilus]|uniref:Thiol reductase thioredoxin n=1 Tax=Aquibacillus halophilus TaxID=930132 RepID=A0A6A8DG45_9BACI|nr:thioredoxin family protein [Aquibacillus halophilus]MRH42819.1 thiol reductase thioredoxin [Aquibacillus halophilus]
MKELQSKEELDGYMKGKTILMFSADWCPDCRVIEPVLPEIEQKYNQFTFVYVDRDQFIDICQANDVFGIPSFLAFENGVEIGRFVSKDRKTKEEIELFIDELS